MSRPVAKPKATAAPVGTPLAPKAEDLADQVTVVTVLHRSEAVIDAALASVPPGVGVVVVDNASPDRSADHAVAAGARLVTNRGNLGFGTGCNRGAALVRTPYTLFLNPDARLSPGSLARLVGRLEADPGLGAVAPLLSSRGRVQMPRRNSLIDVDSPHSFSEIPDEATDVGFLSGAALLVRTDAFRAVGGFDERIFLYLEDDDLCTRLCRAGYRLQLLPDVVVAHEKKSLRETSLQDHREQSRNTLLSMRYLSQKHGVSFDFRTQRLKAVRRFLLALLLLDYRRVQANLGRLQGLGVLPAARAK